MRISDWSSDVCSSDLTPWFGQGVTQGAVFYLAGEGRSQIVRRFNGWAQYHGVSLEGAPIFLADRLPPLHDRLTAAEVIETIKRIADELFFNSGGIDPSLIVVDTVARALAGADENRSEEHTSELQSLIRISYAVFCLKKYKKRTENHTLDDVTL